jgi:hypothetical protein
MNKEWEIKESKNFGKGVFSTRTIEKCKDIENGILVIIIYNIMVLLFRE